MICVGTKNLIQVIFVIVFAILFIFAVYLLFLNFICDDHTCLSFVCALEKKTDKEQIITLVDKLCDDGMWPYAYLASAILASLIFAICPFYLSIPNFAIIFLLGFFIFYAIISFMVHHYIRPIKIFILDYLNNN